MTNQGAIKLKKFTGIMLVVLLAAVMTLGLTACNNDTAEPYTIVYIGDSIAEALIGPSPLSERDNYGYYALIGKTNNFRYYNHSISGHKTSTGIVSNEGLLEVLNRNDENAVLMKTHLEQADMIHISVLGNNMLQYNLGLMMLEVADPDFETKYEAGKNSDNLSKKTLINALEEGSIKRPLVRKSVEKVDENGDPIEVEFAFPPTYQDISDIVDRLKTLNPDATIVFQKVYNPLYEGSKHLSSKVLAKLAEITDDGRFGAEGQPINTIEQLRSLADYLLGKLNGILDMYLASHPGAFKILDARAAFQSVTELDKDNNGNVKLGGDSLGRKLIFQDWTHPSNFGHAVIAGMTQDLLDELKVSSPDAVKNYKAIRIDQIDRLYKNVQGFDADAAKTAINNAATYLDVTLAYFNAIEGYTPVITADSDSTGNASTSFDKNIKFDIDKSNTSLMGYGGTLVLSMLESALINSENTYAEFKTDGSMHFQIQTKSQLIEQLLGILNSNGIDRDTITDLIAGFDIEGGVDSMVEPMFPGFKAKLEAGDLEGALNIIYKSLGFNITGLDYENENIKSLLAYVAGNMALPSDALDLIPVDTVLTLTFDCKYYVKNVKGSDGKEYTAVYIGALGANTNTQPFAVFTLTEENGVKKLFFKIEFMALNIGFTEQVEA